MKAVYRTELDGGPDAKKTGAPFMKSSIWSSFALILLFTGLAAGQTKKWTPPRTPDGQPDLQGFWTNSTYSPLERPANVTKEFFTREEALVLEKKAAEQETEQTTPG